MGLIVCAKYCCFKPLKSSYQTHTEDKTALYDVQTTACEVRKQLQHNTLPSPWSLVCIYFFFWSCSQACSRYFSVFIFCLFYCRVKSLFKRLYLMIWSFESNLKFKLWNLSSEVKQLYSILYGRQISSIANKLTLKKSVKKIHFALMFAAVGVKY